MCSKNGLIELDLELRKLENEKKNWKFKNVDGKAMKNQRNERDNKMIIHC